MTLSFEVLLFIGVIGFYLFDSAMLLYVNELVYVRKKTGWRFFSSKAGLEVLGKHLCFPIPFSPALPVFRVFWTLKPEKAAKIDARALDEFLAALRPLQYAVRFLFTLLMVLLPLTMFAFGTGLGVLAIAFSAYATIAAMLTYTFFKRKKLCLDGKASLKLAFDCLACAPFALNLVRKISLLRGLSGDPVAFAQKNFDRATFGELTGQLNRQIEEALEMLDEGHERYGLLKAHQQHLARLTQ